MAQIDKEEKLRNEIDSIYFAEELTFNSPRIGVSTQNGFPEEWSYIEGKNSKEYIINYYRDSTIYGEMYLEYNGKLLFARLSEDYAPNNSFDQIHWSCNFYIQSDSIATLISLGHGPTEDPEWDENSIIDMYKRRKFEFERMKK